MLSLKLDYDIEHDLFCYHTNIKNSEISNIIETFLQNQRGKGKDNNEANDIDLYEIDIDLDLTDDTFRIYHNCGNKGLREGILIRFLFLLTEKRS